VIAACDASGSLPSTTATGMPNARPRSEIWSYPCWPANGVEMPYRLLVTIMSSGSSWPLRELHTSAVAKSPSAVPASPPWTIVMPFAPVPARCARAVPIAIENCTSIGELTGATFHSRFEKWPAKLRPREYGSVATFFICRSESTGSAPIASSVAAER
jgi:hypothetical protein